MDKTTKSYVILILNFYFSSNKILRAVRSVLDLHQRERYKFPKTTSCHSATLYVMI